jgi:superfamily I DNA/RNA helicase
MLNSEQQQATKTLQGPLRILAGAGTGKTHTLIERICKLIESHTTQPEKILVLTFTNKAVHELKTRLKTRDHNSINVLTFHSLAARLLRKLWNPDFTINHPQDPETLTFDDLLKKFLELFQNPQTLEACQNLFTHILIDEYQDVNEDQIKIMKALAANHKNICVVGDSDQTIYSWRGANVSTMKEFATIYPKAHTIILTKNYRNPQKILESAQHLISKNSNRFEKTLEATKHQDSKPQLWSAKDSWEETEMLKHLLESLLGSHSQMTEADMLDTQHQGHEYTFGDIAIMYRTQEQGKALARKLETKGYPFQRSAKECFWESPEITKFCKDLEQLKNLEEFPELKFSEWIKERITTYIETQELKAQSQNRLKLLLNIAINFDDLIPSEALELFLTERQTNIEQDNLINPDVIQLLTFHAAKGLQFPIVIIAGLEQENMPHKKSIPDPYFLEEERRLLYVGMTRATQQLHLFTNRKKGPASQFLREIIPPQIAVLPEARSRRLKKRKLKRAQMSLF